MKKVKKSNKILKTYFHYALQNKWLYVLVMVIVLLLAFIGAFYPYLTGNIVDQLNISAYDQGGTLILILMGMLTFRGLIEQVMFFLDGYIDVINLERKPRIDYVKKIQNLDFAFHSSKSTGSLISISSRINGALGTFFSRLNIWGLINLLDVIISAYFIYQISPVLSLIFISTIVLASVVGYPLLKWNVKIRKKFLNINDKIGGMISDNMIGFETVKAFGQEEYEIDRLSKKFDKWQKEGIRYVLTFRFFDVSVYVITLAGAALVIYMGYQKVLEGIWSTGILITLIGYSTSMIWKAFNLIYKIKDFMKASVDLKKFVDVMETDSKVVEREDAKEIGDISKGISFKDVCFTYTESDDGEQKEYVLEDVSFDIQLDETVALVGKSGSGKTTLAKLLMRYYDVDKGSIEINGIDIRDLKLKSLRKSIGLVAQDPVMFNETVKYNVSYGNPDASMDDIISATKNASLHKFIDTLPKKYDTVVGERGIKLSGGQRQRLAIARVILENPEIIIFDEATSQLDSENEKAIQEAFRNLTEHKTTIVIAHRLSTIMHADKIVVFDEGKIVETGTHDELMSNKGIYAMLWKLQTEN
jgi:ATP-binding cassette, subfamily B, heavy metal transporter